jgi:hypothetical protein
VKGRIEGKPSATLSEAEATVAYKFPEPMTQKTTKTSRFYERFNGSTTGFVVFSQSKS